MKYLRTEWPDHINDDNMKPFMSLHKELSLQDGCILCGKRVIIPPQGRAKLLQELHEVQKFPE